MSDTFEGPPGSGQAETVVSPQPVNYRDGSGRWQPINDDLESNGATLTNVADAYHASLPENLGAGVVSVQQDGRSVGFSLLGADATAETAGQTATYTEALDGTDVRLRTEPAGVKESLVLAGVDAPSSFTYDLTASGTALSLEHDEVLAQSSDGTTRFRIPPPTVKDAQGAEGDAHYDLAPESGGWRLKLVVDPDWLKSSTRAWPVVVDPTVEVGGVKGCTLDSANPTVSTCNTGSIFSSTTMPYTPVPRVSTDTQVGILRWEMPSSIPTSAKISSATMQFRPETDDQKSPGNYIYAVKETGVLYPVSRAWSSTASWNNASAGPPTEPWSSGALNKSGGGIPFKAEGGCARVAPGPNPEKGTCLESSYTTGSLTSIKITELVQQWTANPSLNYGVGLSTVLPADGNEIGDLHVSLEAGHAPWLTVKWSLPTGEQSGVQYDQYSLTDTSGLSVNVATGNLQYQNQDVELPGPGVPFSETRSYNSQRYGAALDLGQGWKFSNGRETGYTGTERESFDGPDSLVFPVDGERGVAADGATGIRAPDGEDAVLTGNETGADFMGDQSGMVEEASYGAPELGDGLTAVLARSGRGWKVELPAPLYWCSHGSTEVLGQAVTRTDDPKEATAPTGFLRLDSYNNCAAHNRTEEYFDNTGRTWGYSYNEQGELASYTDPNGKITKYEYTSVSGFYLLSKITTPAGHVTTIAYAEGAPIGRVKSITQAISGTESATTQYLENAANAAPCNTGETSTTVTDPLGRKTTGCFDVDDRPTHHFDYYPARGTYGAYLGGTTYMAGNLSKPVTTNPSGASGSSAFTAKTTFNTDNTGNPLTETQPSGDKTQDVYNIAGKPYLVGEHVDAQGHTTKYTYTASGYPASITLPNGVHNRPEEQTFTWVNGLMTTSTLGSSTNPEITSYKYNTFGLPEQVTPPISNTNPLGSTSYTYDTRDRIATSTDGRGDTTTYGYDLDSRTTSINFSDHSGIRYTYDPDGNLLTRVACVKCGEAGETDQTSSYTYDGLGDRLTATIPGIAATIPIPGSPGQYASLVYTYNADGSLASMTDAGGKVSYTYNHDGMLQTVTDPSTTPSSIKFTYDLDETANPDPRGVLTSVTYPNSGHTGTSLTTAYTYDNDGRVHTLTSTKTGQTSPLQSWVYDYTTHTLGNGSGEPTALRQWIINTAGQATGYSYDYLNRLTGATTYASNTTGANKVSQYGYCYNECTGHPATAEGVSNLLAKTFTPYTNGVAGTPVTDNYTYDIANQLLSIDGVIVNHDKDGNSTGHGTLPGSQETPGNRSQELSFNAADQLSQISTPLSVGGSVEPTALTYDDGGNEDVTTEGNKKIENSQVGITATVVGSTPTYYTRTPEGEVLDKRTSTSTQYYLQDEGGTVEGTTDANGTLQQTSLINYDPWGNTTSTVPTFGYHGAVQTPGGLDHFGKRYYDANEGRWTQPDSKPGSDPVQSNLYTYAADDPINNVDPEGTCAFDRYLHPVLGESGGYGYFEICKGGRRVGYLRVRGGSLRNTKHGAPLANIITAGIGFAASTIVLASATVGGVICLDATEGLDEADCIKIMGIGYNVAAGGYAASFGILNEGS
jgi:RHS repeat-associated protein